MNDAQQESFAKLLALLSPEERPAAAENLRRYLRIAIEIAGEMEHSGDLTVAPDEGSVPEGLVDPSTSKKTG